MPAVVGVLTVVVWRPAGALPRAERAGRVAHGEPESVLMAEPVVGTQSITWAVRAVSTMLVVSAVPLARAVLIAGTVPVVGAEAAEEVVAACCPGHDVPRRVVLSPTLRRYIATMSARNPAGQSRSAGHSEGRTSSHTHPDGSSETPIPQERRIPEIPPGAPAPCRDP
jgi:hypothetical protein